MLMRAWLVGWLNGNMGQVISPQPVEKLMHVGKFKNLQHTTNIPIHLAYIRTTESETITERTQVYPRKPSWGRKPSQNFSLDSSTKYNTSTRL
jgi:hypothetical protein